MDVHCIILCVWKYFIRFSGKTLNGQKESFKKTFSERQLQKMIMSTGSGVDWVPVWDPILSSCVTLGMLLNLSVLSFLIGKMNIIVPTSKDCWQRINKIILLKQWEYCLVQGTIRFIIIFSIIYFTRTVILKLGAFVTPPGDIWKYLETLLVVTTRGATTFWWVRPGILLNVPCHVGQPLTTKHYLDQNVNSAEVEKPCATIIRTL